MSKSTPQRVVGIAVAERIKKQNHTISNFYVSHTDLLTASHIVYDCNLVLSATTARHDFSFSIFFFLSLSARIFEINFYIFFFSLFIRLEKRPSLGNSFRFDVIHRQKKKIYCQPQVFSSFHLILNFPHFFFNFKVFRSRL